MTAFETIKKHYQDRSLAALEWKKNGGKVMGYICNNVPEELIMAAGFLPVRLSGDPWEGTELAEGYRIPYPRVGYVETMMNKLLTEKFDYLDYLVVPHSRDEIWRMWTQLHFVPELDPQIRLPEMFFYDNLHTTFYTASVYNRDRALELKAQMEKWSGKKMTDEDLVIAIDITNESRMLLKKVAALRAADPPRVSGKEALQMIGSSMVMPKEAHNELLKEFLKDANSLPAKAGVRLFVESSPLDNLQLYEVIESSGAVVVGEDNCWGNRHSDTPIEMTVNPFESIIDRYLKKSPCPRIFPLQRRLDYCVESAVASKARGTLIHVYEGDNAQAWEAPEEINALKAAGIPATRVKNQPYLLSDANKEELKTEIKEFIEAL
ncbi:MAG: 2-hydroxyacyl-CoA dehydratase family protein [Proteobacteria bacterium]|nr:2-hydroxyacyl-CoA dehydratase family protein [Pseudomonadota bacterium]MBU4471686.1 2-hydroxyacyl-CoA dehydratase family protein [Pseudomonadota bacterium]MCG2750661.1 2-hydroxyacyl-CoA dehydratase family protein [Desulfobacteraceae bacterium]